MSIKQVGLESASSYYTACHSSECTHRQVFLLLQCGCFDLTVSQNPVPGESGVNLNNQEAGVGSTANRLNKKQADLDDEILNSQVYQIYCSRV